MNLRTLSEVTSLAEILGPELEEEVTHILNLFKYKFEEELKYDTFVKQIQSQDMVERAIQHQKLKEFEIYFRDIIQVSYKLHK
jgi:hypothetical protein